MKQTLTLREAGRASQGPVIETGPVYRYNVAGLPPGEEIDIASHDGHSWQILRAKNGDWSGGWTGSYASAEDALVTLQNEQ